MESNERKGRQRGLRAALVAGLTVAIIAPQVQAAPAIGLAAAAAGSGRYFGTAVDSPGMNDSAYRTILTSGEFSSLTPANALKWDATEPNQNQFNFSTADTIVNLGLDNGMMVRGHTLVWHNQLPGWVQGLSASALEDALENHIATVVGRYRGEISHWDVVNEMFNDDGSWRQTVFYNQLGTGYIATALRAARAADPNVKLYLNDYNIDGLGAKSDAMYNLAKSLLQQGVPLDGIGIQGHLAVQYGFPSNMQQNIQRFADLGLDVAITELDVRGPLPLDSNELATQRDYYSRVMQACRAVDRCVGVTIWDFTDKYSWVPNTFSGEGDPLPWDVNLQKKQALYDAIITALGGSQPTTTTTTRVTTTTTTRPTTTTTSGPTTTTTTRPTTTTTGGSGLSCSVTRLDQWGSGYVAYVRVTNNGAPVSSWSVPLTFNQSTTVTNAWNATLSGSGASRTASNTSWNGNLGTGSSVDFGFQGTASGTITVSCGGSPTTTQVTTTTTRPTTTTTTTRPTTTTTTTRPTTTTTTTRPTTTTTTTRPTTTTTTTRPTTTTTGSGGVSCSVRLDQWGSGYVAYVTVTNGGSSAVSSWSTRVGLNQSTTVTNAWNANVSVSGSTVTGSNVSWNGYLGVGQSTTYGFQGTASGTVTATCS